MQITVKIGKKTSKIDIKEKTTINDLLEILEINRETVLVRKKGEICIEEEFLDEGDFIEIIKAVSGG
jgi:sulfur carrier protein